MQHKENPDQLMCIHIKRNAEKLITSNGQIVRIGQAVFNEAHRLFPDATNRLRNTKYDCYYDDSKVNEFLLELQTI